MMKTITQYLKYGAEAHLGREPRWAGTGPLREPRGDVFWGRGLTEGATLGG